MEMNCDLILSLNLKPTLVKACRELGLQTSGTKAELLERLIQNEAKFEEVGIVVSREQLDPEDLNNTFVSGSGDVIVNDGNVADSDESLSTEKLLIDGRQPVRKERNLELLKAVPMFKESTGEIEAFIRRFKSAANISGISPNDPELTGWLLNKIEDKVLQRLQDCYDNFDNLNVTAICLVLKRWYSQKMSVAEAEIGLMNYQFDINDPKFSLSSLRELIKMKYKGFEKSQLNQIYKVKMMKQMNQIQCLRGLVKYARHMEVEELEAEITLELKLVRQNPLIKGNVEKGIQSIKEDVPKPVVCFNCQMEGHKSFQCKREVVKNMKVKSAATPIKRVMRAVDVESPRKIEENDDEDYIGFLKFEKDVDSIDESEDDGDLSLLMVKRDERQMKLELDESVENRELFGPIIDVVVKIDKEQHPARAFIDTGAEKSFVTYEYLNKVMKDKVNLKKYENPEKFKVGGDKSWKLKHQIPIVLMEQDESVETVAAIAPASQILTSKKFCYDVLISQVDARSLGFSLCKDGKKIDRKVLRKTNSQLRLDTGYRPISRYLNNCNQVPERYSLTRLPFGAKPSAGLAQLVVNTVLGSSTDHLSSIGNIIVSSSNGREHGIMLNGVKQSFRNNNLLMNEDGYELKFDGNNFKEEGDTVKIMTVDKCKNTKTLNKDEKELSKDKNVLDKNEKEIEQILTEQWLNNIGYTERIKADDEQCLKDLKRVVEDYKLSLHMPGTMKPRLNGILRNTCPGSFKVRRGGVGMSPK
uniref:SAP domain-containing protein n=1 Tax=Strongyloides papillosus TaxID=174720 RepID=A0A0N5BHM5_STREA